MFISFFLTPKAKLTTLLKLFCKVDVYFTPFITSYKGNGTAISRTAGLVASRMQSRRRSTTKGRITFPYSDCLKSPRRVSAMDQTNALRFLISLLIQPCPISKITPTLSKLAAAVNERGQDSPSFRVRNDPYHPPRAADQTESHTALS